MAVKRRRLTDANVAGLAPSGSRVYGLGHAPGGPRRAGAAVGASKLRVSPEGRGGRTQDHAGICGVDECREGARQVPRHRDRSAVRQNGERRGARVRGIRRGSGARASRQMQTVDAEDRSLDPESTPASGVRIVAPGSDHPDRREPLVRRVQPDRARRGQSRDEPASPNPEPRGPLRPSPDEPSPRHQAQSPSEAHTISVGRRDPPSSPRAGPPCRCTAVARTAGRHHPPAPAHRLP